MAVEQEVAGAAEQAGIPQLDFSAFPNQIFWLVVFLVATYLVVSRVALPRIGDIVEQREKRIKTDLDNARIADQESLRIKEEIANRLAEARKISEAISAKTRAEILSLQNRALGEAGSRIETQMAESERRISEIRESAEQTVRTIVNATAVEIVGKLLPEKSLGDEVERAVADKFSGRNP